MLGYYNITSLLDEYEYNCDGSKKQDKNVYCPRPRLITA